MRTHTGYKNLRKSNVYQYLKDRLSSKEFSKWNTVGKTYINWVEPSSIEEFEWYKYDGCVGVVDNRKKWEVKFKRLRDTQYRDLK